MSLPGRLGQLRRGVGRELQQFLGRTSLDPPSTLPPLDDGNEGLQRPGTAAKKSGRCSRRTRRVDQTPGTRDLPTEAGRQTTAAEVGRDRGAQGDVEDV